MNKSDKSEKYLEITGENLILLGIIFENGCFVALTEKSSLKLGTTALSLPLTASLSTSRSPPSQLDRTSLDRKGITTATVIGSRNEVYTKALSEKITLSTNGLVYLSLNFQEEKEEFFQEALKLVEQFLKKISKK